MSPATEKPPGTPSPTVSKQSASTTEYPKKSNRQKRRGPPQVDKVKSMLSGGWVCGVSFLETHLPRYSPRIHELRREGFQIDRRICQHPWHDHWTVQYQWRIVGLPGEPGRLFGDG